MKMNYQMFRNLNRCITTPYGVQTWITSSERSVTRCIKSALILSICVICVLNAAAQGNVSNIRVQTMDHVLIIQYDLAVRADIEVFASFDGGINFTGPLQRVNGAVGRGVNPEIDKMIVWNVRDEFGAMDNPNAVIKVVSTNETVVPKNTHQSFSSGILTYCILIRADKFHGFSGSLVTITESEFKGFATGLVTITKGEFRGLSGGAVNVSKRVSGIQIGLVNIIDERGDGVQLGLVNIIRNKETFKVIPIINF